MYMYTMWCFLNEVYHRNNGCMIKRCLDKINLTYNTP